jgi:electron-transferring-flavoprotein dehydrogenase
VTVNITMASPRSAVVCLQRNLARRQAPRVLSSFSSQLQGGSRSSRPRGYLSSRRTISQQRAFSVSLPRNYAEVDESFDPNTIDRESDEVDVCIVGGG